MDGTWLGVDVEDRAQFLPKGGARRRLHEIRGDLRQVLDVAVVFGGIGDQISQLTGELASGGELRAYALPSGGANVDPGAEEGDRASLAQLLVDQAVRRS